MLSIRSKRESNPVLWNGLFRLGLVYAVSAVFWILIQTIAGQPLTHPIGNLPMPEPMYVLLVDGTWYPIDPGMVADASECVHVDGQINKSCPETLYLRDSNGCVYENPRWNPNAPFPCWNSDRAQIRREMAIINPQIEAMGGFPDSPGANWDPPKEGEE